MKTSRLFLSLFCAGLAVASFSACRTPQENALRSDCNRGAKVVTSIANQLAPLPGTKYEFRFVKDQERPELNSICSSALDTTLNAAGYQRVSANPDFLLICSYGSKSKVRMNTQVDLKATSPDGRKIYWQGTFSCLSRRRDYSQYLTGLCVCGASYLGKNITAEVRLMKYHRAALEAAYQAQWPKEASAPAK